MSARRGETLCACGCGADHLNDSDDDVEEQFSREFHRVAGVASGAPVVTACFNCGSDNLEPARDPAHSNCLACGILIDARCTATPAAPAPEAGRACPRCGAKPSRFDTTKLCEAGLCSPEAGRHVG